MKVNNSKSYLRIAQSKLLQMKQEEENNINYNVLGKICFNLNKIKEYEDNDITTHELIDLLLKSLDKELTVKK